MKIKVNKYILKSPKISKKTVILNASDIHGDINNLKGIIEIVKKISIDYILLPGDTIDFLKQPSINEFTDLITTLTKYAKVYAVLGNHEFYNDAKVYEKESDIKDTYYYKTINKTKDYNVLFKNETISINDEIDITAINLPVEYYHKFEQKEDFDEFMKKNDRNLNNKKFNITLCHSPNNLAIKNKLIDDYKILNDSNLILSGHNHGGITLPIIQDIFNTHYGCVGPYLRLFQKNAYGIISKENRSLFISNGVTKLSESAPFKKLHNISNKIFKPEIDLIILENGKEHNMKLIKRKGYKV